jgi:hypothetical protein
MGGRRVGLRPKWATNRNEVRFARPGTVSRAAPWLMHSATPAVCSWESSSVLLECGRRATLTVRTATDITGRERTSVSEPIQCNGSTRLLMQSRCQVETCCARGHQRNGDGRTRPSYPARRKPSRFHDRFRAAPAPRAPRSGLGGRGDWN